MIHIVLYAPEIPLNTGNVARTAIATNSKLHLIEPLGFKLDDKSLKRYSAGFMKEIEINVYKSWEDFLEKNSGEMYFLTRYGQKAPSRFDLSKSEKDIYFIFGSESSGIPKKILRENITNLMRLPMSRDARSVNLSNTVMAVVYEVLRQQDYNDLLEYEPHKSLDD